MNRKTICIVDDDLAIRDSLSIQLQVRGYVPRAYPSAADFLKSESLDECGCLILDHHMPQLSGLELLRLLRARQISIPTIVLSGGLDPVLVDNAMQAGALAVLNKPLSRGDLLKWIEQALSSQAN